jgi:cell division protein FtsI/penicillin-binding protein 2
LLENYFGIIEAIFVFSLAIAFYVWQMRDLKKEKAKAEARERNASPQQDEAPRED